MSTSRPRYHQSMLDKVHERTATIRALQAAAQQGAEEHLTESTETEEAQQDGTG